MTPPLSSALKGQILTFGSLKWSCSLIVKELKKSNITVSKSAVSAVLRKQKEEAENQSIDRTEQKAHRKPRKLTSPKVKKVKLFAASDNPPTQRDMARCVGVSQSSIHRLIRNRLERKKMKKTKVHALTEAAIEKRRIRALPFYNLINNRQFEYILTMDEAWLPYNVNHGQRDFFYDSKSKENRRKNPPLSVQEPAHVQKRMFAAGFSWRGPTRLYIVKGDAKINGQYFLEKILKPMMLFDIPRLYGADADKVILHMDSAPSHTSRVAYNWLDSNGIKYFTKEQWLANSPEVSPMDFFGNGYFKAELNKRKYRTFDGMLKVAHDVWSKIPLEMFRNSLESWPSRVLAVHKARGRHAPKYWRKNLSTQVLVRVWNRPRANESSCSQNIGNKYP